MSKSNVIGCDEMRERNIDTSCYGYNRDPGIHKAVIDLMAEARKVGTLRVFLTLRTEERSLPLYIGGKKIWDSVNGNRVIR